MAEFGVCSTMFAISEGRYKKDGRSQYSIIFLRGQSKRKHHGTLIALKSKSKFFNRFSRQKNDPKNGANECYMLADADNSRNIITANVRMVRCNRSQKSKPKRKSEFST